MSSHQNIWKFLSVLKNEESFIRAEYQQILGGHPTTTTTSRRTSTTEENICRHRSNGTSYCFELPSETGRYSLLYAQYFIQHEMLGYNYVISLVFMYLYLRGRNVFITSFITPGANFHGQFSSSNFPPGVIFQIPFV